MCNNFKGLRLEIKQRMEGRQPQQKCKVILQFFDYSEEKDDDEKKQQQVDCTLKFSNL